MSAPVSRRRLVLAGLGVVAISAVAFVTCGDRGLLDRGGAARVLGGHGREGWAPPAAVAMPDGGCPAPRTGDPGPRDRGGPTRFDPTRFAAIGDYGYAGSAEQSVADLVKSWRPEFIVTLGDNNYPQGEADTIDLNIGLFYHDFIAPYVGRFGCGAARNRFFPALGNHDWYASGARPYLDYFTLPGNERYYDVEWGDVHVFALDTDPSEPDGVTPDSVQARWLKERLAASRARWQIVYFHHPPYSSGPHGGTESMRWPFKEWGADLVLAGHDHTYERIVVDGMTYLVNGLGGAAFYALGAAIDGSVARFNETAGALLIEADAQTLRARFQTVDGRTIDDVTLN
jgi:hypothetical protein